MKTTFLFFTGLVISIFTIQAQVPPKTPVPPATIIGDRNHTSITTSVSNSVSVSNSEDSYKFTARFQKTKKLKIQDLLSERLKAYGLKIQRKSYVWSEERNGEMVFQCTLNNRSLKLFLNKEKVSIAVANKIKSLGAELQMLITQRVPTEHVFGDVNSARADVTRAERALQSAKQRLKIVERGNN